MFNGGDLFDLGNEDHEKFVAFLAEVRRFGDAAAHEAGFPKFFFSLEERTTKSGVNYPVLLNEIPYPFSEENGKDRKVSVSIARIEEMGEKSKNHDRVYVGVNPYTFSKVTVPPSALVKEVAKTDKETGELVLSGYDVYLSLYDGSAADYLNRIVQYRIDNFVPSMPSFGCCDKYMVCSEAKKCVQDNPFYFRACQYRKNLLEGNVFYGVNQSS